MDPPFLFRSTQAHPHDFRRAAPGAKTQKFFPILQRVIRAERAERRARDDGANGELLRDEIRLAWRSSDESMRPCRVRAKHRLHHVRTADARCDRGSREFGSPNDGESVGDDEPRFAERFSDFRRTFRFDQIVGVPEIHRSTAGGFHPIFDFTKNPVESQSGNGCPEDFHARRRSCGGCGIAHGFG